ncbi:MAG: hypothetical protein ABIP79_02000 [Chitinophagaceae bacterium]
MQDQKSFKNELQYIINSDEFKGGKNLIKAAQAYLRNGAEASTTSSSNDSKRSNEERALTKFAIAENLWVEELQLGNYITEGAEQKVFFPLNERFVYKLADGIFYKFWFDYFNNLLLHNTFFPSTAYELVGFLKKDDKIHVVIKQPFIVSTEATNLENVKQFLLANGFIVKKNNDYYNPYLGIILEDLHDENVLTSDGILFFVDTVFYIMNEFHGPA